MEDLYITGICASCRRDTLFRRKQTPKRNSLSVIAAPFTGGLSLLAFGLHEWSCVQCGEKPKKHPSLQPEPGYGLPVDEEAVGRWKKAQGAPIEQAFCATCWHQIHSGDAWCPTGHPLARGWEEQFEYQAGVPPLKGSESLELPSQSPAKPIQPPRPVTRHEQPAAADVPSVSLSQASCPTCGSPIYAGDSFCVAHFHRLEEGWEKKFADKTGVPPRKRKR